MAIDIVQWWYEIGGVKHGPCSAEGLRELITGGQIDSINLLWRKGLDNWIQAGSTAEFAGAFAPEEPPPLPETPFPVAPSTAGQTAPVSLWARFWARALDAIFFGVVIGIPATALLGYVFPSFWIRFYREAQGGASLILTVMITPIWLIAEALALARWGTTPGKLVAGIVVQEHEGNPPSIEVSFARSFHIWWRALGLSLPLVSLVTLAVAYGQSKLAGGIAPWDKKLGLEVRAAIPRVRTAMAGAIAIVATFLVMIVNVATQQNMQRRVNAAIPSGPTGQGIKQPDWDAGERTLPPCPGSPNAALWTNCVGELTYSWGEKYVGEFKDGKENGRGTLTWHTWPDSGSGEDSVFDKYGLEADGKYVGMFKDGKQHGQGTYTYPDGRKYVGDYKDGKRHGQGTYTWPDGRKYVGDYEGGVRHGQGTLYRADGTILQSGIWENNVFVGGR